MFGFLFYKCTISKKQQNFYIYMMFKLSVKEIQTEQFIPYFTRQIIKKKI